VRFFQDQQWHSKLAEVVIKGSPDAPWTELVCDVAEVSGVHAVVLSFEVKGPDGPLLDWWKFE
jgi:hypothetical protein